MNVPAINGVQNEGTYGDNVRVDANKGAFITITKKSDLDIRK